MAKPMAMATVAHQMGQRGENGSKWYAAVVGMGVVVDLHLQLSLDLYNLARRDEDFCPRKRSYSRKSSDPVNSSHIIVALAAVHVCATFFPHSCTEPRPDPHYQMFLQTDLDTIYKQAKRTFLRIKKKELGLEE